MNTGKSTGKSKERPVTIRFRSVADLAKIRRAARIMDWSLNKFVAREAAEAAERVIQQHEAKQSATA